jgi:hypothetical protein
MDGLRYAARAAASFRLTFTVPRPMRSISREHFEFQMLCGVCRDLQSELLREGGKVRVYVPFGIKRYPDLCVA